MNEFERYPHNNRMTVNKHIKNCVELFVFTFGLKREKKKKIKMYMGKATIDNRFDR